MAQGPSPQGDSKLGRFVDIGTIVGWILGIPTALAWWERASYDWSPPLLISAFLFTAGGCAMLHQWWMAVRARQTGHEVKQSNPSPPVSVGSQNEWEALVRLTREEGNAKLRQLETAHARQLDLMHQALATTQGAVDKGTEREAALKKQIEDLSPGSAALVKREQRVEQREQAVERQELAVHKMQDAAIANAAKFAAANQGQWPEISRLKKRIAELEQQLNAKE